MILYVFTLPLIQCMQYEMPEMAGFRAVPNTRTMKTVSGSGKVGAGEAHREQRARTAGGKGDNNKGNGGEETSERALHPVQPLSAGEKMIADDVFDTARIAVKQMWPSRILRAKTALDGWGSSSDKCSGETEKHPATLPPTATNSNKNLLPNIQPLPGDSNAQAHTHTHNVLASMAHDLWQAAPPLAIPEAAGVRAWAVDVPLGPDQNDVALTKWIESRLAGKKGSDAGGEFEGSRRRATSSDRVAALRRFEAAALLAAERYLEVTTPNATGPYSVHLLNVQLHVLPGGRYAYELDHVAPDHVLPSGLWCIQRKDEDKVAPLTLQLLDPRGDAPNMHPLPAYLQAVAEKELPLDPGAMYLMPGNVPRHITPNLGSQDVAYISFQFAYAEAHDQGDTWLGDLRAESSTSAASSCSNVHVERPHPSMLKQVYTITPTDPAAALPVALTDVQDSETFATPVLIMHTAGETSELLAELATSDAHFLRKTDKRKPPPEEEGVGPRSSAGTDRHAQQEQPQNEEKQKHIFQSDPKRINAMYDNHNSPEAGAGLRILRRVLHRAVEAYLNSTLDCIHIDGPRNANVQCEDVVNDALMQGMQRAAASPSHAQLFESWVNVAKDGQVAAYQRAHNHLATYTKAAITAVYYASTGSQTKLESKSATKLTSTSTLILGRPVQSMTLQRSNDDWHHIEVSPGMLVIFPVYLKHVGDVHKGQGDRISIASNIAI